MTDHRPSPMTPPDCDLRDFRGMMFDFGRFFQSDLVAESSPEEVLAAIHLWGAAWHNVPAGSLKNKDRALAKAAGFGHAVDAFLRVKEGAMHGFVECSDGRLYHRVVCEKALSAWEGKLKQRHRTFCATIRKHNERHPTDKREAPTFDAWQRAGRPESLEEYDAPAQPPRQGALGLEAPDSDDESPDPLCAGARAHSPARAPTRTGKTAVTHDTPDVSRATADSVTRDTPGRSRVKRTPRDRDRDRDRETLPNGLIESLQTSLDAETLAAELATLGAVRLATAEAEATATREVATWLAAGISPATMREAVTAFTAKATTPTRSLHRFDGDVRLRHTQGTKTPRRRKSPASVTSATGPDDTDPRLVTLRENLRQRCGDRTYDGWVAPVRFTLNGTGIIATMPSMFMRDWLQENLGRELAEEAARLNLGHVRIDTPQARGAPQ